MAWVKALRRVAQPDVLPVDFAPEEPARGWVGRGPALGGSCVVG